MKNSHSAQKTPIILHKIADLTAIRDVDVFEFSFLKSLAELLKTQRLSIYKFKSIHEPCRILSYRVGAKFTDDKQQIDESREIQFASIDIPEIVIQAKQWIDSTGRIFCHPDGELQHSIYPIAGLNGVVGYLSLHLKRPPTDAENLVISSLLSISHNFHNLLEENQKDKLTGLLNRKTFDENVFKIQNILNTFEQSDSYQGNDSRKLTTAKEYWLAILDIDNFKRINDSFGHIYGDEVLLLLSQLMKRIFRPADLLFRYGGEEFIVIIEVENMQLAINVFERFRIAVETYSFPQVDLVTVSLGATKIDKTLLTSTSIVGQADQALYHSKENGKNMLSVYEQLVEDGVLIQRVDDSDIELF